MSSLLYLFFAYTVGLALFQANAIQFGLDQLLEAPTPKLICFHPLVLLGSECWQFGIILCYSWPVIFYYS